MRFVFITLAAQHASGLGVSQLLRALGAEEEAAYLALQRAEWDEAQDLPTRSHRRFSGVPYHHHLGKLYGGARFGSEFESAGRDRVV